MKLDRRMLTFFGLGGIVLVTINELILQSFLGTLLEEMTAGSSSLNRADDRRPLWPQTDFSVRQAIQQREERIDPLVKHVNDTHYLFETNMYETPPTKTTLVSAFYQAPHSKHTPEEYEQWATNLFSSTDPLVFFCDPEDSKWTHLIWQHRQHAPTYLVTVPFQKLPTVANFDASFWKQHALKHDKSPAAPHVQHQDITLYQIWNAKIIFLREAARVNPFGAERFLWIDADYYRDSNNNKNAVHRQAIVRNPLNGVKDEQVLIHNVLPERFGYLAAGGIWGGTAMAIEKFYKLYWKTFWFMALHDVTNIGYEQHVFVHLCKSHVAACNVHYAGGTRDRRIMGEEWIRNPAYDFSYRSATRLFYDVNITQAIGNQTGREPYYQPPVQRGPLQLPEQFPIRPVN